MAEPINCILHEDRLTKIEKSLDILLKRDGDFKVKVINGRTEERLASELIGELYVDMKKIKEQREAPKKIWKEIGVFLLPLINLATIVGLLFKIFGK